MRGIKRILLLLAQRGVAHSELLTGAILRNDFDNADFSEVNLYG